MSKKYLVSLSPEEKESLEQMLSSGREKVRKLTRARILLKANDCWSDEAIRKALDISTSTIGRIRRRFMEEGLRSALNRQPSARVYKRKLDGNAEAHLVALARIHRGRAFG